MGDSLSYLDNLLLLISNLAAFTAGRRWSRSAEQMNTKTTWTLRQFVICWWEHIIAVLPIIDIMFVNRHGNQDDQQCWRRSYFSKFFSFSIIKWPWYHDFILTRIFCDWIRVAWWEHEGVIYLSLSMGGNYTKTTKVKGLTWLWLTLSFNSYCVTDLILWEIGL